MQMEFLNIIIDQKISSVIKPFVPKEFHHGVIKGGFCSIDHNSNCLKGGRGSMKVIHTCYLESCLRGNQHEKISVLQDKQKQSE